MYPDPFYNSGGAQSQPMWMQMPPGFSPMPFPGPVNFPGEADNFRQGGAPNSQNFGFPPMQGYPFPGFGPPPPPNFSGYCPM